MRTGLILCSTVLAGTLSAQDVTYRLPIREHVFSNGLRLLVWQRPGDARVAAKIFTDMGGVMETPGYAGAAHFLEHLLFKGTHTLGTTDWAAERPIADRIVATEAALLEEENRARNALQERGVFHDYAHARTTPRRDSLRSALAALEREADRYRDNGAMLKWYQAFGGAAITATTEQEWMKFDVNLPKERIGLFLRVEADRMQNAVFREFDQERMIVVEQRLGDLNRPSTPYYEAMSALVGVAHPVFWPEGWLSDFASYTRASQRTLYQATFVPNNTTIVLVGGVSLEEMVPQVERYFGWMARAPEPPRVKAVEPQPQAERRLTWRSEDLEPRVEARFLIPGVGHPDRPGFDVLSEVIELELADALAAANLSARVDANTRVIHTSRFGVPGSINVEVVVANEGQLAAAERVLLAGLEQIKASPVNPARLALARKRLRTQWHRTVLEADQVGFEIGHFQVMDTWQTLGAYLDARERTTADDLKRLAARYFIDANRSIGIVRQPDQRRSTQ
ncbi:MAG: insulinase family protein [Gemmatimonadaceae bacterium]|nr:insulinase family protein [Gemmatimonadaceae bacterium]